MYCSVHMAGNVHFLTYLGVCSVGQTGPSVCTASFIGQGVHYFTIGPGVCTACHRSRGVHYLAIGPRVCALLDTDPGVYALLDTGPGMCTA